MSKRGEARRAKKLGKKASRKPERDKIPPRIKLAVRQRCGFGCVLCGVPIYHYDHMEDWAVVQKHEAENLTLLCPSHHQEKTSGLLALDRVREANANPFNLQAGHSTPRSYYFGSENPTVVLGAVAFTHPERDFAAIVIDGVPIVGFRFVEGHATLQLRLFDAENKLVLQVADSELVYRVDLWDIEFVGSVLTVRQKERDILLKITFEPAENSVQIERGTLQYNKIEVEIWPECMAVLNAENYFSGFTLMGAEVGFAIGTIPRRLEGRYAFAVPAEPRVFDRDAARKSFAAYRKSLAAERKEAATAAGGTSSPSAAAGE